MSKHSKQEDNSNIQVYFDAISNALKSLKEFKPEKFENKDLANEFLMDLIGKSSLEIKLNDLFNDKEFNFPKHSFRQDAIATSRYTSSEIEFLDAMFGFVLCQN